MYEISGLASNLMIPGTVYLGDPQKETLIYFYYLNKSESDQI